MTRLKPSYIDFDHQKFQVQLRKYSLVGEVGVLSYQYSKQIVKLWRFRTPELAQISADRIYLVFLRNISVTVPNKYSIGTIRSFIKADLCRKFLLMGYTRSMRYARHSSGRKWGKDRSGWYELPLSEDLEKKKSAQIFDRYYQKADSDAKYQKLRQYFKNYKHRIEWDQLSDIM